MKRPIFLTVLGWFWISVGVLSILMGIVPMFFIGLPIFSLKGLVFLVIAIAMGVGLIRQHPWIPYVFTILLAVDSYIFMRDGGAIVWIPLVITTTYVLWKRNLFARNTVTTTV